MFREESTDVLFHGLLPAIKFGQKLSYEEQVRLISDLEKTERRFTCPHGRPTMIQLTFNELDKRFGRKLRGY